LLKWPKTIRHQLDKFHIDILDAAFCTTTSFDGRGQQSALRHPDDLGPASAQAPLVLRPANLKSGAQDSIAVRAGLMARRQTLPGWRGIANPIGQIWCGAMVLEFWDTRTRMTAFFSH
jgi:tartrate dehydrogenase/decarboxylase/D-malate dehydrogenase